MRIKAWILCAVLLFTPVFLTGCVKTAVTVGGIKIDEDTYRYVYMKNKEQLFPDAASGKSLTAAEEKKLDAAVRKELSVYAAEELLLKEYGIKPTDDIKALIKERIKETEDSFDSKEEYRKELKARYMTEDVFYDQTMSYYMSGVLFEYMTDPASGVIRLSDEQLLTDIEKEFGAAIQVFLPDKAERGKLEEIRGKIIGNGKRSEEELKEIFLEAAAIYSKDTNRDVRYFVRGEMVKEFEDAAFALDCGEISEIVESDLGLHLILRVKITDAEIDSNFEYFRYTDLARIYNELLADKAEGLEFVYEKDFSEKEEKG